MSKLSYENDLDSNRDYSNDNPPSLEGKIDYRIRTTHTARKLNRNKSERFRKYSRIWNFLFFIMNFTAITLVFLTFADLNVKNTKLSVWTEVFSVYSILCQYFIGQRNYREKALKLNYFQLNTKQYIDELENIFQSLETNMINKQL